MTPQPATFDERFIEAFENVAEMRSDIRHMDADVSTLKFDVTNLKSDVSGLKTDVSVLKVDVSTLKSDVSDPHGRFGRLDALLGQDPGVTAGAAGINVARRWRPLARQPRRRDSRAAASRNRQIHTRMAEITAVDGHGSRGIMPR